MQTFLGCLIALLFALPMGAQMPSPWRPQEDLGRGLGPEARWWGGGLWAGAGQGPPVVLEEALGLGNALTGTGFHLEGGARTGSWDFAAEVLGVRAPEGEEALLLYRSHALWKTPSGWQAGFEQEPLVWGYGLHGGYLLGEAGRPFPRFRLATPFKDLRLFRVPLGAWSFQTFVGKLENHRALSPEIQDASWRARAIAAQGDPQAPLLNGYRVEAAFGGRVTFYANYLNLWSGTLNGQGMTRGYGFGDYLTSMLGLKDTLAEGTHDPNTPPENTAPRNKGRSASEMDWGLRVEVPVLAGALGAEHAWLSVARGSKSMGWPIGVFVRDPVKYGLKDAGNDFRNLVTGRYGFGWNYDARYSVPSEINPNDCVDFLASWGRVRLGLEYLDTTNPTDQGHRTFAHSQYLTGFYYHGDPLGEALAGETRDVTARLDADLGARLTLGTWLTQGKRPFRDEPTLWALDHPGRTPGDDRLFSVQESLRGALSRTLGLELGAAWARHGAVDYEAGRTGNGFRWFTNLTYRWPSI